MLFCQQIDEEGLFYFSKWLDANVKVTVQL